MTYSAHIFQAGIIETATKQKMYGDFDVSGALAALEFTSIELLVKYVKQVDWVKRPNGKLEQGFNYSIRKAKNDYKFYE